ncbi:hypothetical protein KUTeg_018891 [Tegillarca granosa]|uniref:Lipocalin/cytosolic fatty-acid binding domain-containing protein n=1 Tax=Tegillarca granosa TaxID=220873 RepID=A0ABQ9EBD3_TEGGR|nr:hypothetical protein KUTeg_018891 [Tegillarca granosa]
MRSELEKSYGVQLCLSQASYTKCAGGVENSYGVPLCLSQASYTKFAGGVKNSYGVPLCLSQASYTKCAGGVENSYGVPLCLSQASYTKCAGGVENSYGVPLCLSQASYTKCAGGVHRFLLNKMMSVTGFCVLFSLLSLSAAQVFTLGKFCKSVNTVKPFDLNKYLGDWYEIVKFKANFEDGQKCVRANYQLKDNGRVRVDNKVAPYGDYWILNTDYESYSLIYSCTDAVIGKVEFAWILSRKRTLDQTVLDKLYKEIASYDVNTDKFMTENQSNCPNN